MQKNQQEQQKQRFEAASKGQHAKPSERAKPKQLPWGGPRQGTGCRA